MAFRTVIRPGDQANREKSRRCNAKILHRRFPSHYRRNNNEPVKILFLCENVVKNVGGMAFVVQGINGVVLAAIEIRWI